MKNISYKILKLRKDNNLTQTEMAECLGVSRQAISSWESGRTVPGGDILQKIINTFGVDFLDDSSGSNVKLKNIERNGKKMIVKKWLFVSTVLLSTGHMGGAFLGNVSFPKLLICPLLFLFIHSIMHIGFGSSIKNNDFTMISGYNKKTDSDEMVIAILSSIELYTGIFAVLCNIIFCFVYFVEVEAQMGPCLALAAVFVSFVVVIGLVVKYKYSRKLSQDETKH